MSMLRSNLQSFLLGASVSLGAGYYFLHQDIWRSADLLGESLGARVTASTRKSADLEKRVDKLEAEVAALKVRKSTRPRACGGETAAHSHTPHPAPR
jgi:hypothetical protein